MQSKYDEPNTVYNVNAHIHTPYSFSAFEQLTDVLDRASDEDVRIVGINDFYSMDGFLEWNREALKRHLFPLFNIELISLQVEEQVKGFRVNDPNNPGRTYLSGKGLCCPPVLNEPYASQLEKIRSESNLQVADMCLQVNHILNANNAGFNLDFDVIKKVFTKGLVRERHLAKALRMSAYIHLKNKPDDIYVFFEKIFNGKPLQADIFNYADVENEIRNNLLKAGGAAFVPEKPNAFLPIDDVCSLILAAGGIPTYPFLGDDKNGHFTEFEYHIENAAMTLHQKSIFSVEFITTRNTIETLEKYAGYLHDAGFVVTFGTEHNTPAMEPVLLSAKGNTPLTERLKQINYSGACVIAAHQVRVRNGKPGYVDVHGKADITQREDFIYEGDNIIKQVIQ